MSQRRPLVRGALVLAALLALGGFAFYSRTPKVPEPTSQSESPSGAKASRASATTAVRGAPPVPIQPWKQEKPPEGASPRELYLAQMASTKAALLEKTRYPLGSRPLAKKTDALLPHHVEPTFRGLTGGSDGTVQIRQDQDRLYLSPGQPATVMITATKNGGKVDLQIPHADLIRHLDGKPDSVVGSAAFTNDGQAPDLFAGDETWSALVQTPSDGIASALELVVVADAEGSEGTLRFPFVATAAPPAVFTQTARDALENGSVAIYVGISVQNPGTYEVIGRLYDATGAPVVYMRFLDTLTTSSSEVRLLAFGKVLLDEGAVPPFTLKDVEGWRMSFGEFPDRALMADWPANYTTANYPVSSLSAAEYAGADKAAKIAALDNATQEGLANIANGANTPSSNGAPTTNQPGETRTGSGNH